MRLKSLGGCRLAIGRYPTFSYDARGGGGNGVLSLVNEDFLQEVSFDNEDFVIPPLSWKTTKVLGLPIPPGLKIAICTEKLKGVFDKSNGKISLDFEARFRFSICSWLRAPDLIVKTCLNTGKVKSRLHNVEGQPIQEDGRTTLVGVSVVPRSGSYLLDSFLSLPNEALAVLECEIELDALN